MIVVSDSFFDRDTLTITRELPGKLLVRRLGRKRIAGRIVEVEAYIGEDDPACHAFRGLTPRTKVMYGPPGHAYVYFTYGMHFMLNVVTEKEGYPAAILIRALEPVFGWNGDETRPFSGPGKLCKNLQIDKGLNGISLRGSDLWIAENERRFLPEVRWSPRIGISAGTDKLWRAFIPDNPYVSRSGGKHTARTPSPL